MQAEAEDLPPFWLQNTATRRRSSSLFLNSGVLVLLLLVTAILSMFFVIPSILSVTAQIFKPHSVKKSWDSLNIVLVLFAIVFGFLSRNKNEDDQTYSPINRDLDAPKSNPSTPRQWFQYSDRPVYNSSSLVGLRRTSSSYPDLRQVSPWLTDDDRWRFFDDTHVDGYRLSDSDPLSRRRRRQQVEEDDSAGTRNIHVDTLVNRPKEVKRAPPSQSEPPRPSPPPPSSLPLPPPVGKQKPKRTYPSLAHKEKTNREVKNASEPNKSISSPVVPPPPPPPPPPPQSPPSQFYLEQKGSKSNRKRGGANATRDFLTSFYHQRRKKKKQRQKSVDNFENLLQPEAPSLHLQQQRPPPPPPPPPPSVFHDLFSSKKSKTRRTISVPPPPPHPPPQPFTAARASKATTDTALVAARRTPPVPVKINSFNSVDDNSNSGGESPLMGNESPLITIPPPPPPPPFKMPAWKFVVQGDYVRLWSNSSSRSGSPDLDDVESPSNIESASTTAGDAMSPLFCPSPDVDTKADNFIANFRAGLRLEKMDSIKKKHGLGMSNLGPERRPSPEIHPGPSHI